MQRDFYHGLLGRCRWFGIRCGRFWMNEVGGCGRPTKPGRLAPATRGDPMRPLKWTSKSLRKISTELTQQGWHVSPTTIGVILRDTLTYRLPGMKKTKEGATQHPDRDAQFHYLSEQCRAFQRRGQPVISVDAKKKELIGAFKNGGREW